MGYFGRVPESSRGEGAPVFVAFGSGSDACGDAVGDQRPSRGVSPGSSLAGGCVVRTGAQSSTAPCHLALFFSRRSMRKRRSVRRGMLHQTASASGAALRRVMTAARKVISCRLLPVARELRSDGCGCRRRATRRRQLPLKGAVVTGDAAFCRRALCEAVRDEGGGHLFTVKANQPGSMSDIAASFGNAFRR